jgi:1-acyl-sn-glycerol-3-phosphate acyltransferase
MQNFMKNLLWPVGWLKKFMEIYGIIGVDRQFGYKRGSLPGLKLGGKAR